MSSHEERGGWIGPRSIISQYLKHMHADRAEDGTGFEIEGTIIDEPMDQAGKVCVLADVFYFRNGHRFQLVPELNRLTKQQRAEIQKEIERRELRNRLMGN